MLFKLETNEAVAPVKTSRQMEKLVQVDQTLSDTFGQIEQGTDYPFATGAMWSTHDLIKYILRQIGPAELTLATWSVSQDAAGMLMDMQNKGIITRCSALVDWRVKIRTPDFLPFAKLNFNDVRVSSCHAKAFVLINDVWAVSLIGSANLTNNPRIECGHLSTSRHVAEFHKSWILAEINKAKPFGEDMQGTKKDGRK